MAIQKPNLSSIVSGQLPDFVRDDYPTFVAFLESYYEYLDTQIIADFETVGDIDTTFDSFLQHFKDEFALCFPATLVDERFLLPKLKELYVSKGTPAAYNLLFRILYNKEIEITEPSLQMLRISDGKWHQDISIFARMTIGQPEDIVGNVVEIISNDRNNIKKIKINIDRFQTTDDPEIFEFFTIGGFTGSFNIGDLISHGTDFIGIIVPTTSTLTINQRGIHFRVGQIYEVGGVGTGSLIKINSVDANGGITAAEFIDFGTGYPTDFRTNILALHNHVTDIENYFTITDTYPEIDATIVESIDQLSDSGYISTYDYAVTYGADFGTDYSGGYDTGYYVNPIYVGELIRSFDNYSLKTIINPNDYAVITFHLGSFAKYPGYYINNNGFLNDNMVIQDSKYYQVFSYVIQIDKLFESYKSVVKNLLHPSGLALFGDYNININLDATTTLEIGSSRFDSVIVYDYIATEDLQEIGAESEDFLVRISPYQ